MRSKGIIYDAKIMKFFWMEWKKFIFPLKIPCKAHRLFFNNQYYSALWFLIIWVKSKIFWRWRFQPPRLSSSKIKILSSASFPVSHPLSLPPQSIVHFAYTGYGLRDHSPQRYGTETMPEDAVLGTESQIRRPSPAYFFYGRMAVLSSAHCIPNSAKNYPV